MSSQKTSHQKLNSYYVMNSLGGQFCPHSRATIYKKIDHKHGCIIKISSWGKKICAKATRTS